MPRSDRIFYPRGLWVGPVENRCPLWTRESSAQAMHSPWGVLPSAVPSFTQVPHSPTQRLGVTAFTRTSETGRFLAEQWTGVWRSCGQPGSACGPPVDNADHSLWTECVSTGCGVRSATIPQPSDLEGSSLGRSGCGCRLDNSQVPRLWTEDSPRICGEQAMTGRYSNRGHGEPGGARVPPGVYAPGCARRTRVPKRASGDGTGRSGESSRSALEARERRAPIVRQAASSRAAAVRQTGSSRTAAVRQTGSSRAEPGVSRS